MPVPLSQEMNSHRLCELCSWHDQSLAKWLTAYLFEQQRTPASADVAFVQISRLSHLMTHIYKVVPISARAGNIDRASLITMSTSFGREGKGRYGSSR